MKYNGQIGQDLHEEWKGEGKVSFVRLLIISLTMTFIVIEHEDYNDNTKEVIITEAYLGLCQISMIEIFGAFSCKLFP